MLAILSTTARSRFAIALALFLAYLGVSQAVAQQPTVPTPPVVATAPTIADPKVWVGKFLQTLHKNGVTPAVEMLMNESLYSARNNKVEIQKQLSNALNNAGALLGQIVRTEMVEVKNFGTGLTRYRALVHYQQGPVLVEITFHKAEKQWVLIGYNINGSISVTPF